jgi:hypothetical protein
MKYNFLKPWETLDDWQMEFLRNLYLNKVLRSGRQVGKSTIVSIGAGEFALKNSKKNIMIIASVERQAQLLFEKVLSYIHAKAKNQILGGKDKPTRHKLTLKNGTRIYCLPTGDTGYGIRGYTIDLLIADEAAFIGEDVWTAVTPMMAVTKGKMWLLSTPLGKKGYFYRCFDDENFEKYHIRSTECPRRDEEFLKQEEKRMTKAQFAQEYLGEFIDQYHQFFPDDLIKNCMTGKRKDMFDKSGTYYLGVDIARMGEDESTFEIIDRRNRDKPVHVENLITRKTITTETTNLIIELEKRYNFKQIFIDDGGMGVGVFDQLLSNDLTKRKVVAINNSYRPLDKYEKQRKKLIKQDIYANLLSLMEKGNITLLDDDEIFLSLKSIQYEYDGKGNMKIYGKYAHIADGLVRAAWCVKDKSLNIYLY